MNNKNENNKASSGVGFCGLLTIVLTIVFIVLQLLNMISWSWAWVLAPLWIPTLLGIIVTIFIVVLQSDHKSKK